MEEKCCLRSGEKSFPVAFTVPEGKKERYYPVLTVLFTTSTPTHPIHPTHNFIGYICKLSLPCIEYALKVPTTCIKSQAQMCCCVQKAALPPDAEIPMVCAICFVVLHPIFGCMKKFSEITEGAVNTSAAPAA